MKIPMWTAAIRRGVGILVCAFVFAVALSSIGLAQGVVGLERMPASKKTTDDQVAEVLELIKRCPAWTRIDSNDQAARQKVIACIDAIVASDTAVIRKAIQQFVTQVEGQHKYDTPDMSKIFLLNRYLFNVPSNSSFQEARFFGGWRGVPHDDKKVDLLWPFKKNTHETLDLVGEFGGYMGEPFEAVKEFDYFDNRFGRRKQH